MNSRPDIFSNPKIEALLKAEEATLMPRYLRPSLIRGLWAVIALLMGASGLILYGTWSKLLP